MPVWSPATPSSRRMTGGGRPLPPSPVGVPANKSLEEAASSALRRVSPPNHPFRATGRAPEGAGGCHGCGARPVRQCSPSLTYCWKGDRCLPEHGGTPAHQPTPQRHVQTVSEAQLVALFAWLVCREGQPGHGEVESVIVDSGMGVFRLPTQGAACAPSGGGPGGSMISPVGSVPASVREGGQRHGADGDRRAGRDEGRPR